jgi:hypothetical protein
MTDPLPATWPRWQRLGHGNPVNSKPLILLRFSLPRTVLPICAKLLIYRGFSLPVILREKTDFSVRLSQPLHGSASNVAVAGKMAWPARSGLERRDFEMKHEDIDVVRVPTGTTSRKAIAAHRRRTGYGGGVFLILGAAPNTARRAQRASGVSAVA